MKRNWPDLCEAILSRLEELGEDTTMERAEFAVLVASCAASGCKRVKKGVPDGENNS